MKLGFNARNWHNWISIGLAIPILIVAATAVFIAHDKQLGLKDIDVSRAVSWLPGYGSEAMKEMKTEIRSSMIAPDGLQWVGTKAGLYQVAQGRASHVAELGATEVRDMAVAPFGAVVAAKNGVWVKGQDGWRMAVKGDAWSASLNADGAAVVTIKDKGVLTSRDGATWVPDAGAGLALASLPAEMAMAKPVTLGNLVMDMHTGKAFFGKEWEWIWIDLIGLVMVFLGLTGVYMWWRAERRKEGVTGT